MPVAFLAMFARQIRANTGQYQNIPPISRRCQFRWSMLWAVVEIVWNIESRLLPRGSKFYVYCLWLCKSPCAFFPFGLKVLILKYLALKYKEPTCFKICMVQCDGMSYALLSLDFSWEMNDRLLLMLCWWCSCIAGSFGKHAINLRTSLRFLHIFSFILSLSDWRHFVRISFSISASPN